MPNPEQPANDTSEPTIDVLLCYRGRYRDQVIGLAQRLRRHGLRVTYDQEILTGTTGDETDADVQWFTLIDQATNGDMRWRAPLSRAIRQAFLTAFLFHARDQSDNMMNEIAWVSRAEQHIFFAIDTGSSATTEEDYECIILGMLQSWFGQVRATLQPDQPDIRSIEIPHFGYHFIAHDDPRAIEERLDVLANRIVSYLERVRVHGLRPCG